MHKLLRLKAKDLMSGLLMSPSQLMRTFKSIVESYWLYANVDCARSGDFRSITHHFRTRRSVDQLQTAAVDEYDLQQQPQSDAAAAARSPHHDSTMLDEMTHMSQKMMDVVDVRIEGMEDMLHHLQTTVHQLGNKVSADSAACLY